MTVRETYQSRMQHIHESPKFQPQPDGGRHPVPFPGYTVITPPSEDESENAAFYKNLQACQQQLLEQLDSGLMVPVPPESFHCTLADLIWDGAYLDARAKPNFDELLHAQIAQSFANYKESAINRRPIRWLVLGLMVMPRALGVCLVPGDEDSYEQIVQLRRAIYQNPGLIGLGVEQQYHFTGHITLGYFGEISPQVDRDRLSTLFCEFTNRWLEADPQELWLRRAELRKFDDMTRYYRSDDWPVLEF